MIWNETKECMSRDEIHHLQGKRLVKTVNHVYHNVEFYRKKMDAAGVSPEDIHGIEDITKLPFTTKDDLRDNYPFEIDSVAVLKHTIFNIETGVSYNTFVVLDKNINNDGSVIYYADRRPVRRGGALCGSPL